MPKSTISKSIVVNKKPCKIFGRYGSEDAAKLVIRRESEHGASGKLAIAKIHVGKSVDPAYSDKNGYAFVVYYRRA
jgi:hypothetical protein